MLGASFYTFAEVFGVAFVSAYILVVAFVKLADEVEHRKKLRTMAARRRRRELRDAVKPQRWTYRDSLEPKRWQP